MAGTPDNRIGRTGLHSPGYRPDIDGLRGVAVAAVVLYHWDFPGLGGGLSGVDVFFVISGFLITRILWGELQSGDFSVVRFYERRIRRIFPALFVVLAASAAMAWALAPPPDVLRLGQSLAASALFVANFYFLATGSYLGPAAQHSPLLHLWSLAVEEQFYLVFPWMLLAVWSWWRSTVRVWLSLLAVASFVLALTLASFSASAAFYFSGARFWELLLGSLVALAPASFARTAWAAQAGGIAGLALIVAALSGQWGGVGMEGAGPVVACVGAALVVALGGRERSLAGRVLSSRALVSIGLISYSLYLWHWPLLVLHRLAQPLETPPWTLLLVTVGLSVVTWKFVEQPVRAVAIPATQILGVACVTIVAALGLAAALIATDGGAARFSARVQWLYSFDGYEAREAIREGACFLPPGRVDPAHLDRERCIGKAPGKPDVLLVGDSHAAHLWWGLSRALPEINLQQATASGCRPLLHGQREASCGRFMDAVLAPAQLPSSLSAVVLSGRWSAADIQPLRQTIADLSRVVGKVYVLGPSVEYREELPRILAMAERRADATVIDRARVPGIAELDRLMGETLAGTGAIYLSLYRALCPSGSSACKSVTAGDGVPIQYDYGHFTPQGSVYVGQRLRPAMLSAGSANPHAPVK